MAKFTVDDVEYEFVQSPTFGEARAIEKVAGVAFAAMGDPSKQSVDFMQALVWISMRRVDPDITFDDLDDIDMGVLGSIQEATAAPADPTEADVEVVETPTLVTSA